MDPYERRIHLVFVAFVAFLLAIVFRLFWIQALQRERYNNPTGIRYHCSQTIKAERGCLLDTEGRTLASCVESWFVAANPQLVANPDYWAHRLAKLLGKPESVLRERLRQRLRPVVLRKGVPLDLKPSLQPLIQRGLIRWEEYALEATFSIWGRPALCRGNAAILHPLCQLLGLTPEEVNAMLASSEPRVCLAPTVDRSTAHQLEALALPGVEVQQQPSRTLGQVTLTPHPWDVRWIPVSQRGNPSKKVSYPVLRQTVWQDLAPVWEGCAVPDKKQIESRLKCSFVFLKRQVPAQIRPLLEPWKEQGLILGRERSRIYPFGDLARELLGDTDVDEHGISGLEKAYERVLSGVDGVRLSTLDALGNPIPQMEGECIPPIDGKDVVLTLDVRIQEFAEAALAQALVDNEADWGVALVLNPYNGEILALANETRKGSGRSGSNQNYAFVKAYEPGSVFKPITVCAALEEGLVTPDSTFHCGGVAQVGSTKLHCISYYTSKGAHGAESVAEAVRDSCNVVLLQIGRRLGQEKFEKWIKRFHLLERSGLSIVEQEAKGRIYTNDPQKRWSPQKVATVSYGKGIQLTALALARAYCPIVNGGDLPRLRLVKRLIDRCGKTVVEIPTEVERGILRPQTAAAVRKMLYRVVWDSQGTGHTARSSLYETAGKTGTSVGYSRQDPRIVSFLGFAPYHHPRVICSVLVANPRKGSRTGSGACGPAFRTIVERTLNYLGVPPATERVAKLAAASEGSSGAAKKDLRE